MRSTFGRVFQRRRVEVAPDGTRRRVKAPGWYVRVRVGDVERTRYAGADRKTAVAFAAQLGRANDRAVLLGERTPDERTFADVADDLRRYFRAHHGAETWRGEASRVEAVVERFRQPIHQIAAGDVASWRTDLKSSGLSDATVNRHVAALSVALRFAVERGYAVANVARGLPRPREAERAVPFVSDDDVARIVAACPAADGFRAFVRVLADTGLRRGEALRLAWGDVDLAREWRDGDTLLAVGAVVVRESKAKRPRMVPLTPAALDALRSWHAVRGPVPLVGPDLVFPALAGPVPEERAAKGARRARGERRPDPSRLSKAFRRVAVRAGFPTLTLHGLRHGCASRLAQRGVPLVTIGALLGHADQRVTLRYAAHLPDHAAAAAIARLSAPVPVARDRAPRRRRATVGDTAGDTAGDTR